ncbi:MAG: hypothetical protein O3B01_09645, partial [Planctomycetota bacterium]|nr:hypothetical protein [Planctomycetota bacterium]MDA1138832.1 hypothetical protein [Planctomycetota bacterium]
GANCLRPFGTIESGNIILAGVLSINFRKPRCWISLGNLPQRSSLKIASVSFQANDWIIQKKYRFALLTSKLTMPNNLND